MARAKRGDRIRIEYTARLADGTIFDTTFGARSPGDEGSEEGPFELTLGEDGLFVPVEQALLGMAPGERKTLTLAPHETFGEHDPAMIFTVLRDQLPESIAPAVGQELELVDETGEVLAVTVVEVTEESVTIDANHPLTGQDLTFELELVEILP